MKLDNIHLMKVNDFPAQINLACVDESSSMNWFNPDSDVASSCQNLQDLNIYHDSTLILVKNANETPKEMTQIQREQFKRKEAIRLNKQKKQNQNQAWHIEEKGIEIKKF